MKYTVLLIYPDDGEPPATYLTCIEADTPEQAANGAKEEAVYEDATPFKASDFGVLLIIAGEHEDLTPRSMEWNRGFTTGLNDQGTQHDG
jgi:hypothetical protein